jgi:hypothetical protein
MSTSEETGENTHEGMSRRDMLKTIGGGALAAAALAIPGVAAAAERPARSKIVFRQRGADAQNDINILNFALQLEYLESEFYNYSVVGQGLISSQTTGTGNAGPTTGGAKVDFSNNPGLLSVAEEIRVDENLHVEFLRTALGSNAVAKPAINLAALNGALDQSLNSSERFLVLSRYFEDVGVTAYLGAAGLIKNPAFLIAAAKILATEAYHAGNIRLQVALDGLPNAALDSKDQPSREGNVFPSDALALSIDRTVAEVKALVGPFFPNGLNGNL